MQLSTLFLILGSVAMSTSAQLLLKTGMSNAGIKAAIESRDWWQAAFLVATNPWVGGGLTVFALSAAVWLLVLAKVEVSFAYPFVGIGFVVTMLLGWWLLGDTLNVQRISGTLLIAAGVVLVARGG